MLPDVGSLLSIQNFNSLELKDAEKIKPYTNNVLYDNYAKNNKHKQSFGFVEYFGEPLSVVHKIEYHKKNTTAFRQATNRTLLLVVVANKEDTLSTLNSTMELSNPKYDDVAFTTIGRLKQYPFNKAIFKFTSYGTAYFAEDFKSLIPDQSILQNK